MKRWIMVGSAVAVLALVGCSKDEPTASTPTTSASASSDDAPTTEGGGTTTETLALEDCLAVGLASLGVISGSSEDADKLKSFDPPEDVKDAVDVIVANGGIQIDGTGQDEVLAASETVTNWIDAACPDS